MRFPVASEAFASNEVLEVSSKVDLTVCCMRRLDKEGERLLQERKLIGVDIRHGFSQDYGFITNNIINILGLLSHIIFLGLRRPVAGLKSLFLFPKVLAISAYISRNKVDVVHLFWGHYPSYVAYLVRRACPNVVISQFLGAYDLLTKLPISREVSRSADVVWTHCQGNVPNLKSLGVISKNLRVLHRGIRIPPSEDLVQPRREVMVLTAGRLIPSKRFSDVINTFDVLSKIQPGAKLVIAGAGPEMDNLTSLVRRLGLEESVRFLGHVPQSELASLMLRARVFLFLSRHPSERLPNVVKEAMLHGCVPVVSKTIGINELISADNGIVLDDVDYSVIAHRVLLLLNNDHLWESYSANAKSTVLSNFSLEKQVSCYMEVWSEASESKHR